MHNGGGGHKVGSGSPKRHIFWSGLQGGKRGQLAWTRLPKQEMVIRAMKAFIVEFVLNEINKIERSNLFFIY